MKPEHTDEQPVTQESVDNRGTGQKQQVKEDDIGADNELKQGGIGRGEKFLRGTAAAVAIGAGAYDSSLPPVHETSGQPSAHTLKMSADEDRTRDKGEFEHGGQTFRYQTSADGANIRQDDHRADHETATFDHDHKSGGVTSDQTDRAHIPDDRTTVQEHEPQEDNDADNRDKAKETVLHGIELIQEQKFEENERKNRLEE